MTTTIRFRSIKNVFKLFHPYFEPYFFLFNRMGSENFESHLTHVRFMACSFVDSSFPFLPKWKFIKKNTIKRINWFLIVFSIIDESDCISLHNFTRIDNIHLNRIKYSTCAQCCKYNILLIFGFFHRLINFCQKHSVRNITNKFIYVLETVHKAYRTWKAFMSYGISFGMKNV